MAGYHRLRRAWYELISNFPEPISNNLRIVTRTSLGYLGSITLLRTDLVPPLRLRVRSGLGNWTKVGKEFLDMFVTIAGLTPSDSVLEVGCGLGRIAIALLDYLDPRGSYEGFDIFPEAIEWCQARITPRSPNFRFQLVDIRNATYNPNGSVAPERFTFPYSANSFDFVYLTSVFTHMLPPAVGNYLREIARVLKTGSQCLITYFLLNEEAMDLMESGRSEPSFPRNHDEYRVQDPAHPERAVAYDVRFLRELYAQSGLKIADPIRWGSWCGRDRFLSFQDIVIAKKG